MILGDHDVPIYGDHLKGQRIGFVITGGIAAYTAPSVIRSLRRYGCEVFPYMTENALKFVTEETIAWAANHKVVTGLTDRSEHLGQDNQSFDGIVVYPATYNFIAKIANGFADDACSTLMASHMAIAPVVIFPAMHGNMWDSMALKTNLSLINLTVGNDVFYRSENGKINVPSTREATCQIVRAFSKSKLKGINVLVTAGPTPTKIDNVRRLTNKFSGKLGIEIANELFLRGANVRLFQSVSGIRPPSYIPHYLFEDYAEYKQLCLTSPGFDYMIASAAVADYQPEIFTEGKIPSGGALKSIPLVPTEKVIDLFMEKFPKTKLISFKYQEGKTLDELLIISESRLSKGHHRVVANDLTLNNNGKQRCFICSKVPEGVSYQIAEGKVNIARMIADDMEGDLK